MVLGDETSDVLPVNQSIYKGYFDDAEMVRRQDISPVLRQVLLSDDSQPGQQAKQESKEVYQEYTNEGFGQSLTSGICSPG
jgi:hypothetical protein